MDIQKLQVKMKVKKPDVAVMIFKPGVQECVQLSYLYRPLDVQAKLHISYLCSHHMKGWSDA